jgi:aminopeptidase S
VWLAAFIATAVCRDAEELLVTMSTADPCRSRIRGLFVGVSVMVAVAACGTAGPATAPNSTATAPDGPLAQRLKGTVTVAGAMTHLQALQKVADENGGNRAAGTRGYEASVEYVVGVLRGAGFEASTPSYAGSGDDGEGSAGSGRNVVAQTRSGDPGRVVVIGAHLDSVPEGPGIVDNGSGVAALLEIATRLGAEPSVQNTVRFAFFGNEESGAEGSAGYLQSLSADDRKKIKLYLNVDMVASPNGGYLVQGGRGSDPEEAGPVGSATIGQVLADQLTRAGVSSPEVIEFVGDDESAFIEAGIPVGGAENGDAKRKTPEQARAWGGQAGQVYDRCYHKACDRLDNVNQEVLGHYLPALAGTLAHFATSTDELG